MTNWNWKMWLRWLLVTVALYVKCVYVSRMVDIPYELFPNLAAAMLVALPVIWTKRKYIVWLVLGIVDIWLITNVVYFRAYHLFLTWHLISFATNISGFESSVTPYLDWKLLWLVSISLIALPSMFLSLRRGGWRDNAMILLLCVICSLIGSVLRWHRFGKPAEEQLTWEWINPCRVPQALSEGKWCAERQVNKFITHRSILSYPLYMANDAFSTYQRKGKAPELTQEEEQELAKLIGPKVPAQPLSGNLVLILLESFESWLLEMNDADGNPVCPNIYSFMNSRPVLYVKNMDSQIRYGQSGDGQMIVNTGLFPTINGVACMDYGYNPYPNYAHFYPRNAIINPCRNVWNKNAVTRSYGYQRLIEPETDRMDEWTDSIVIDKTIEALNTIPRPCCIMSLSISMHSPFNNKGDDIPMDEDIPVLFQNYMRSAHYTDRHVGRLLAWADTAQVMQDAVIVITSDHHVFHAHMSDEIREYGLRANLPFGRGPASIPLVIAAPSIEETRIVERGAQVDVFSSIMHVIGQKEYYWKGLGHDLMEEPTGSEEENALRQSLGDKLIRMNYFEQYEQK